MNHPPPNRESFRASLFGGVVLKVIQQAALLLSGGLAGQVLSFLCVVLTARALGPAEFGVFALVQGYVNTVCLLATFESWQAITRFGAEALHQKDHERFLGVAKLGLVLDSAVAVLGFVLSLAGVYFLGEAVGISDEHRLMTMVYSTVALSRVNGSQNALLRLFDNYRTLAWMAVLVPGFRVIGVAWAYVGNHSVWAFVIAWMIGELLGQAAQFVIGWRTLGAKGSSLGDVLGVYSLAQASRANRGIWRFVLSTNVSTSIRLAIKEGDVLIIGWVLGVSSAGLYRAARDLARIPAMLVGPLQSSLYPELARCWAARNISDFRRALRGTNAVSGLIAIVCLVVTLVGGRFILSAAYGHDFVAAASVTSLYMVSVVVFAFGIGLLPAVLSVGRADSLIAVYGLSSLIFIAVLLPLLNAWGVDGAGVAQIIFQLAWYGMMLFVLAGPVRAVTAAEPIEGADEAA